MSSFWRGALRGILAGLGGTSEGGGSYASGPSGTSGPSESVAYFEMMDPGSSHWVRAGAGVNSPGNVSSTLRRIADMRPGRRVRAVDRKGALIDIHG